MVIVEGSNTGISAVYPSAGCASKVPRTGIVLDDCCETIKFTVSGLFLLTVIFFLSVPSGNTISKLCEVYAA